MRRLWLLAAVAITAAGCGSRSQSLAPRSGVARASFAIKWPDRSRLIPAASNSLKIELRKGDALLAGKVIDRPADGGTATVTFENLPVGDLTATATAYPQAGAAGTPQAQGTIAITARDGETVNSTLNLASTIDRLEITPSAPRVFLGGTLQLAATARNAAGEVVLIAAEDLRWTSSDATKAAVDAASGLVTGVAIGTALITATESESGKAQSVTVTVTQSGLAAGPWPKFRGDAANTGRGLGSGAVGVQRWRFMLGGPVWSSPAIGADGTVYAATYPGGLQALDGATGVLKWRVDLGGFASSPALGPDGTVYVRSGALYALDGATGAKKWEFPTSGTIGIGDYTGHYVTVGPDGTVYAGSGYNKLYAVDGATGTEKWEFVMAAYLWCCPAIGADGTVYLAAGTKMVAVEGATGTAKWVFATGGGIVSSPALGPDGTVYVDSGDGKVYALDGATGAKKWEFATRDLSTTQLHLSSPAVGADGTIYIGSTDHSVYALDGATGTKKWEFTTGGVVSSSPAIGADGTVYVGSDDGELYAFDGASGAKKWMFDTPDAVRSSPAIGLDGTLYVGCQDQRIYAIR